MKQKDFVLKAISEIEKSIECDERVLWNGLPDRDVCAKRIKVFYWKNAVYFTTLLVTGYFVYLIEPPIWQAYLGAFGVLALMRLIGLIVCCRRSKRKFAEAYALTNRRLVWSNGRNKGVSSWYAPSIDYMRVQRFDKAATLELRDTEMRFGVTLRDAPEPDRLLALLQPYATAPTPLNARRKQPFKSIDIAEDAQHSGRKAA